jgi:serine protease Do
MMDRDSSGNPGSGKLRSPVRGAALLLAGVALAAGLLPPAGAQPASPATACHARGSLPAGSLPMAVARNAPAVVNVIVMRHPRNPDDDPGGLDYFPPLAAGGAERSTSSGFILGADGWIIASAHAVYDALETWVLTADGGRHRAEVVGFDRRTDIAVLRIGASGLPVVSVASGGGVCAGEPVAAIGSPFGFDHSATAGVVSAYPRFIPGSEGVPLIQTDVALNPGSSGGPLFNASGAVVGMNSMIYSASGIYVGVSFALPIDTVLRVARELQADGHAATDIGVSTQPVTVELARAFRLERVRGLLVVQTRPGWAAARAGLRGGDILLAVNGVDIEPGGDIAKYVAARPALVPLVLRLWRDGAELSIHVEPAREAAQRETARRQPVPPETRLGLRFSPPAAVAAMPSGVYVDAASGSSLLAGIEAGDRIVAVNSSPVSSEMEFDAALAQAGANDVVALLAVRGGVGLFVPVRRRDR